MRFTSADRELAIASIEQSLTACLSKPIRDGAELVVHRAAEVIWSEMCRHRDIAKAFSELKKVVKASCWSRTKSVIGDAMGKDERTVQRLTFWSDKMKSAREESNQDVIQTSDQSLSDNTESNVSSVTAMCLTKVVERAGRRFTPTPKVHKPEGSN